MSEKKLSPKDREILMLRSDLFESRMNEVNGRWEHAQKVASLTAEVRRLKNRETIQRVDDGYEATVTTTERIFTGRSAWSMRLARRRARRAANRFLRSHEGKERETLPSLSEAHNAQWAVHEERQRLEAEYADIDHA